MSKIFKHLKRANLKNYAYFFRRGWWNAFFLCGSHRKKPYSPSHLIYNIWSTPSAITLLARRWAEGAASPINGSKNDKNKGGPRRMPRLCSAKATCINEGIPSRPANGEAYLSLFEERVRRGDLSIRRARREADRRQGFQSSCSSRAAGAWRRVPHTRAPVPSGPGC